MPSPHRTRPSGKPEGRHPPHRQMQFERWTDRHPQQGSLQRPERNPFAENRGRTQRSETRQTRPLRPRTYSPDGSNYCASPPAAALDRFRWTTKKETRTPSKYSNTIAAMKISIVVASGVGVATAASTVII